MKSASVFRVACLASGVLQWIGSVGCERLPTLPVERRGVPVQGVTLVDWTANGYGRRSADRAIEAIASVGATDLAIVVTAYQQDHRSNEITGDSRRTPAPSAVIQALTKAQSLGLEVAIKPHVDLEDGSWRGHISPSRPAAWFASYARFLLSWARMAESVGSRRFFVGTELASTLHHTALWRQTISQVKSVFSGELVYAASWDEAFKVPFWEDLDVVGVDFYFPVAARRDAGRLEILANWQPWLDRLGALHTRTRQHIILTEIGYRSVDGAGMHPYAFDGTGRLDLTEQADLYWAALEATAGIPWLLGMYWWNWPANGSGGVDDTDFTPAGKPAQVELTRRWSDP